MLHVSSWNAACCLASTPGWFVDVDWFYSRPRWGTKGVTYFLEICYYTSSSIRGISCFSASLLRSLCYVPLCSRMTEKLSTVFKLHAVEYRHCSTPLCATKKPSRQARMVSWPKCCELVVRRRSSGCFICATNWGSLEVSLRTGVWLTRVVCFWRTMPPNELK